MCSRIRGFTLIELMVTISIIGLAMTIVFFQIDTILPGTRLQAACRKLVSDIESLRLSAIMVAKQPIYLEYDLEKQGYRAYLPVELDEEGRIKGPGETELLQFNPLPEGIVFTDIRLGAGSQALEDTERITILINPDGSVSGHIAHIQDLVYASEYSMRISSLTGFAEIFEERLEYEEIDESSF